MAERTGRRSGSPAGERGSSTTRTPGDRLSETRSRGERTAGEPTGRTSVDRSSGRSGDRTAGERTRDERSAGERTRRSRGDTAGDLRRAEEGTRRIREIAGRDPQRARDIDRAGRVVSRATGAALNAGLAVSLGYYGSGWNLALGYNWGGYYGGYNGCYGNYWYWWGYGGYGYSSYCHPFSYPYYCYYGYWPRYRSWYPNSYSPYYSYPSYYSSVITRYVYDEPQTETVYVETEPAEQVEQVPVGEGAAYALPRTAEAADSGQVPSSSSERATGQYLTLGDQAFRDGRYADAVHFYARAVQFSPAEGVLWLVLSDGLFATGDYHYGAFALRKALELDPTLVSNVIDKHDFYSAGADFDRQLAVLEGYVLDHTGDADAVLMLAANYLFGGRPAAAVDLLESDAGVAVRLEDGGALLLEAARQVQYGQ